MGLSSAQGMAVFYQEKQFVIMFPNQGPQAYDSGHLYSTIEKIKIIVNGNFSLENKEVGITRILNAVYFNNDYEKSLLLNYLVDIKAGGNTFVTMVDIYSTIVDEKLRKEVGNRMLTGKMIEEIDKIFKNNAKDCTSEIISILKSGNIRFNCDYNKIQFLNDLIDVFNANNYLNYGYILIKIFEIFNSIRDDKLRYLKVEFLEKLLETGWIDEIRKN